MKTICLYFEIHQIIHLKRYRFFEIGSEHYYYDDYANEQGMNEVAERSYIPALRTLIDMAKANNGAFKVALSISGVALEQLEIHAPAVIELLHELNATGCCEFLCAPFSSSLWLFACIESAEWLASYILRHIYNFLPALIRLISRLSTNACILVLNCPEVPTA